MVTFRGSRPCMEMLTPQSLCGHANSYIFGAEQDRAAQCLRGLSADFACWPSSKQLQIYACQLFCC